jgi:hypothetical protein
MSDPRTNSGAKLYIGVDSVTNLAKPQSTDLDALGFEALTWLEVKNVGNFGETGSNTNIVNFDTLDTKVTRKSKGITDAGNPELQVARIPTDPGQVQMRAAAATRLNYAFKFEQDDAVSAGSSSGNGTTFYNRGIVTGPRHPNGGNEDFVIEIFQIGCNQEEIVVEPT